MTTLNLQQRVDAFSDGQGRNLDLGAYLEELGLDFRGGCLLMIATWLVP